MKNRLAIFVLLALGTPIAAAGAQIVRGTVTERATGNPMPGVVITLVHASSPAADTVPLATVLTSDAGVFAVRAPSAGRYRVSAKQIGVRRLVSDPFDVAVGETKRVDLVLDAVAITLPEVRVVAADAGLCTLRDDQKARIGMLWDEARTALTATQISLRDRLFRGRIARYVRELEPRTMRVLSESRASEQGVFDRAFTSLSGDSLAKVGYWRRLRDSSLVFDAPDAAVLMSQSFKVNHCYALTEGGRDRRGMVGITFEPHRFRRVPDIRGAFWLDAKSFELRLVDFRYTRLDIEGDTTRVGGEVHFARLPSGAWVVRRWFIRMPQLAHYTNTPVGVEHRTPMVLVRPGIYRLVEEGGDVFADGIRFFEKPARIAGVVLDSAGAPVAGATVRLAGTPFTTPADSGGRFSLDSLPPGTHTLLAEHPRFAALGMPLGDETVSLEEGETQRVTLRAPTTAELLQRLCEGTSPRPGRATLRLTMLDSRSEVPLAQLPVWLHWTQPDVDARASDERRLPGVRSTTDARGIVTFCDLPDGVQLELEVIRQNDQTMPVAQFRLQPGEITARIVKARP
jgi:hypothetical protein